MNHITQGLLRECLEALDLSQGLLENSLHHGKILAAERKLRAALAQPECGYDDTTGNCTRENCCRAAQPEPVPPAIPKGYALVPIAPTKEMSKAGGAYLHFRLGEVLANRAYAAMLAAAKGGAL